jgi:hypothetical protein
VESLEIPITTATGVVQNLGTGSFGGHNGECLRRLFWASWTTNVINSDHYIPGSAADTLVLTLPLPISEIAFLDQKEEPFATISQSSTKAQPASDRLSQEPSVFAEVMKCLMIW